MASTEPSAPPASTPSVPPGIRLKKLGSSAYQSQGLCWYQYIMIKDENNKDQPTVLKYDTETVHNNRNILPKNKVQAGILQKKQWVVVLNENEIKNINTFFNNNIPFGYTFTFYETNPTQVRTQVPTSISKKNVNIIATGILTSEAMAVLLNNNTLQYKVVDGRKDVLKMTLSPFKEYNIPSNLSLEESNILENAKRAAYLAISDKYNTLPQAQKDYLRTILKNPAYTTVLTTNQKALRNRIKGGTHYNRRNGRKTRKV